MGTTQQVILTTTVTASAALTQQRFVGADNAPCQAGAGTRCGRGGCRCR
jgi:hypothetical protein